MEYKLFDEYITLQALLKEVGIIQSGGAIKAYLQEHEVFFNGELENRRGKKVRIGDIISIPQEEIQIQLTTPSPEEVEEHRQEMAEKERISQLVKEMNKQQKTNRNKEKTKKTGRKDPKKAPVRFPGAN